VQSQSREGQKRKNRGEDKKGKTGIKQVTGKKGKDKKGKNKRERQKQRTVKVVKSTTTNHTQRCLYPSPLARIEQPLESGLTFIERGRRAIQLQTT
jgi:hypothetical protein